MPAAERLHSTQSQPEEPQTNLFADLISEHDGLFDAPTDLDYYYNGNTNDDATLAVGLFFLGIVTVLLGIYVPLAIQQLQEAHTVWV